LIMRQYPDLYVQYPFNNNYYEFLPRSEKEAL